MVKLKVRLLVCLAVLFGALLYLPKANASDTQLPAKLPPGVTVSPAFQQASINTDEAQHSVKFNITNNESSARTFDLSVQDFNTLGESGGLFFAGTNPTELQKKYGLAKWLSLPQKSITIQPKQTASITADILNLPDLNPGGHYGALMLQAENPGQDISASKVAVHPIASSLLFVTKVGGDTHRLSLASVSFNRTLFSLPSSVRLRFHNDGNTHLIPRGNVFIKTASGKIVSRAVINQDSNIILPETYRIYDVPLNKLGGLSASGTYQLHVDFRFDGIDAYRGYQQSFIVIQPWTIAALLVLALGALSVFVYLNKLKNSLK